MYPQLDNHSVRQSTRQLPWQKKLLEVGIILILLLSTIAINFRMLRDGLHQGTDTIWHLTWLQNFSKQLSEGILYPRWLADTNYGYGSPTFVFYPPLAYYFGSLLKFVGFDAERTLTYLFSLALFFAGFNFYLYGRQHWGVVPACGGYLKEKSSNRS